MKYKEDDILQQLLLSDIYFFTRYFYKELNKRMWIKNWHFEEISQKLNSVLSRNTSNQPLNIQYSAKNRKN